MREIRSKFTRWYIKRGYTFNYEIPRLGTIECCARWDCPWWVRPLLIFFSPSVYVIHAIGNQYAENLRRGIEEMEDWIPTNVPEEVVDKFNSTGCTSFIMSGDEIARLIEKEKKDVSEKV